MMPGKRPAAGIGFSWYVAIFLWTFLVLSCTRQAFSITQVDLYPSVIVSHRVQDGISTVSEGLGLMLKGDPLSLETEYQVAVKTPSGRFLWEFSTSAITVADVVSLVKTDLMLPPDQTLESGGYPIELFLPDGRRFTFTTTFERAASTMLRLSSEVSAFPPLQWEQDDDGSWTIQGPWLADTVPWNVMFYDAKGNVLASFPNANSSLSMPDASDSGLHAQVAWATASRFDAESGVLLVVRANFT